MLAGLQKFAQTHTGRSLEGANVKFYSAQSLDYAAVFAVITLGQAPNAAHMINVFGKFDSKKIGHSINVPTEMSGVASTQNPQLRQLTVYKGDAVGDGYFRNPANSPPPCDKFNYSIMILGEGQDEFGIKKSTWKQGDPDVYSFSISKLTELEDVTNVGLWCKDVLPRKEVKESSVAMIVLACLLGVLLLMFVAYRK